MERVEVPIRVTAEQAAKVSAKCWTDPGPELAEIRLENHGLYAEHNMPCAVCLERLAVFDCQATEFHPCWECQRDGRYLGDRNDSKVGLFGAAMGVMGLIAGVTIALAAGM